MYTKWPEAYALPNQEADTVAQAVMDNFVCRFGCPHRVLSDQCRNYESRLFRGLCHLIESVKQRTTPYHPQCDGGAERLIRTVTSAISKKKKKKKKRTTRARGMGSTSSQGPFSFASINP